MIGHDDPRPSRTQDSVSIAKRGTASVPVGYRTAMFFTGSEMVFIYPWRLHPAPLIPRCSQDHTPHRPAPGQLFPRGCTDPVPRADLRSWRHPMRGSRLDKEEEERTFETWAAFSAVSESLRRPRPHGSKRESDQRLAGAAK